MGSCPDSCVRGLAKTSLESGFFKKTGFVWTDSLGTLTISADVFPVAAPEKLLFGISVGKIELTTGNTSAFAS